MMDALSSDWITHDKNGSVVHITFNSPVDHQAAFNASKYKGHGAVCTKEEWDAYEAQRAPETANSIIFAAFCQVNNLSHGGSEVLDLVRHCDWTSRGTRRTKGKVTNA